MTAVNGGSINQAAQMTESNGSNVSGPVQKLRLDGSSADHVTADGMAQDIEATGGAKASEIHARAKAPQTTRRFYSRWEFWVALGGLAVTIAAALIARGH